MNADRHSAQNVTDLADRIMALTVGQPATLVISALMQVLSTCIYTALPQPRQQQFIARVPGWLLRHLAVLGLYAGQQSAGGKS